MPTFENPAADAGEVQTALRALAHAHDGRKAAARAAPLMSSSWRSAIRCR